MIKNLNLKKNEGSLSHLAFNPYNSLGRRFDDDQDSFYNGILDPFHIDREKIRLSKSYRRLEDKTQVFSPRVHSNIRNRSSHTNEVSNVASIVASILGLNVYLAEAIAYGHDIGHAPYGHLGERFLTEISGKKFSHNVMSVVVAQRIERKGLGLNLTYEVLEGILNHSRGSGNLNVSNRVSEEANLIMYADKIAYTFSDINDAIRIGVIKINDLPKCIGYFGKNQRDWVAKVIVDFVKESVEEGKISFSKSETSYQFAILRDWMYKNVYFEKGDIEKKLFEKLKKVKLSVDKNFGDTSSFLAIGCMTDSEIKLISRKNHKDIKKYGFAETFLPLLELNIDIFNPDLDKSNFVQDYL